ncbi:MAG: hypothetical protein KDA20_07485 [Phycisphaerales bacterium]|nr:hypothetical protein [Phycisphaerales bacterium]
MHSSRHARQTFSIATLIAATWTAAPQASATVSGYYNNSTNFNMYVTNMPDFDQVRAASNPLGVLGLANNGVNHCVPTSALNLCAYIAKHGYPSTSPGVANWQSDTTYNVATINIGILGAYMNTDPFSGGTGGEAGYLGLIQYLADPYTFDVDQYYPVGVWSPNLALIAQIYANGGLANLCYGRYSHNGSTLTTRNSGHCVTPVRVSQGGLFSGELRYRDPATGGSSMFNQSDWATTTLPTFAGFFTVDGQTRVMTEMLTGSTDGQLRIIDTVYGVTPISGLTNSPTLVKFLNPSFFSNYGSPPSEFAFSAALLADLALDPDGTNAWVLVENVPGVSLGKVQKINRQDGTTQTCVENLNDPKAFRFNRHHELYILDGRILRCVAVKQGNAQTTTVLPGSDFQAIACDPSDDSILVLNPVTKQIAKYPRSLTGAPTMLQLPTNFPLSGKCWFDCCPEDKSMWLCSEASDSIFEVHIDPLSGRYVQGPVIAQADIVNPRCINMRMCDQLIVACDGSVKEFRYMPGRGDGYDGWIELNSVLQGINPGLCFDVSRSNSNHDPAVHGPEFDFDDTPPDQIFARTESLDCIGDMDGDDDVDLDDLQAFLFEFGEEGYWRNGDFSQNGLVDLEDLQLLLFYFGEICN